MSISAKAAVRVGAGLALALMPALAFAQAPATQAPQRPAQRPAQPAPAPAAPAAPAAAAANAQENLGAIQTPWVKLCDQVPTDERTPPTTKKLCMVVQETRAETGQMLASVQIRDLEGEKPRLIIAVPVGMSLQPGIRVVLEGPGQPQPQAMRYEVCLPNACFAQMELPPEFLTRMKRSTNLNIQVVNMNNRAISLGMSLQGFQASYDGEPVDPRAYEESQRRLQAELQRRGEEAQRRLQEQQQRQPGAMPGAVPVPGAPAGMQPLAPPQR
ncbi:MAG: invasion associated locus B family protein [Phreatobacter sp.]|uniref:invasion associated locus B family protein n=1 Tax=Phreatobacter sp. TaxID=1966341 RepID=UPI002737245A|nr:invasion associated locus B family protein [Phreatobacter sp.]MDP2801084.1 invasion associated locus B family protein [Phreatobacter sp.]